MSPLSKSTSTIFVDGEIMGAVVYYKVIVRLKKKLKSDKMRFALHLHHRLVIVTVQRPRRVGKITKNGLWIHWLWAV